MTVSSRVLTDRAAFESLAREWDDLVDASCQRSYFMRWRWNFLWWTHLAPAGAELRIIECRDAAGTLVGLTPLYMRRRRVFKVVPIRELVFLGTGVGLKTSEYLDVTTRRGYEEVATRSMASALMRIDDWDRLWCSRVPDDSPVMRTFVASFPGTSSCRFFERAPYVDTSQGWDGYKRTLGRSMRRNVEYYARRLFKRYECAFQRVRSHVELQSALLALVALHVEQWHSRGAIGSLSDPTFQRFLQDAAGNSFHEGRLRVWTLRIRGRIEAVLLGFLEDGVLHYFQAGYNPAFGKDDLGTALVSLCIRDCCSDPDVKAFDFMGGGAEYKEMWARQARRTILGEVSRQNFCARAFELRQRLGSAATTVYRAVTPRRVRAIRRDWLRARYLRGELSRLAQHATGLVAAISTLTSSNDWVSACVDAAPVLGSIL